MKKFLIADESADNVATILADGVKQGETILVEIGGKVMPIKANADIPFGHKIAIKPIKRGEAVIKYGSRIGLATQDIDTGDHVHIHNIESLRGRGDLYGKKGASRHE